MSLGNFSRNKSVVFLVLRGVDVPLPCAAHTRSQESDGEAGRAFDVRRKLLTNSERTSVTSW